MHQTTTAYASLLTLNPTLPLNPTIFTPNHLLLSSTIPRLGPKLDIFPFSTENTKTTGITAPTRRPKSLLFSPVSARTAPIHQTEATFMSSPLELCPLVKISRRLCGCFLLHSAAFPRQKRQSPTLPPLLPTTGMPLSCSQSWLDHSGRRMLEPCSYEGRKVAGLAVSGNRRIASNSIARTLPPPPLPSCLVKIETHGRRMVRERIRSPGYEAVERMIINIPDPCAISICRSCMPINPLPAAAARI